MFYTGGLSFNLAKNPHYIRSFNRACAYPIPGYRPPGYNALRTTLLQKERLNIERMLEPIKLSWQQKGVSVCSDGCSDSQRRPLINVMSVCESGPMFMKAVNCEGESKDKHFISDLLIDSIKEIGPQNVVQVITYNASACKAAGAPQRAEDLVYVHNNLRLLSRRSPQYKAGEMWDIGGDDFDSMDIVNAGMLEVANLSLDEPELEAIIFDDNDDDDVGMD